jgi:hypothetical protein
MILHSIWLLPQYFRKLISNTSAPEIVLHGKETGSQMKKTGSQMKKLNLMDELQDMFQKYENCPLNKMRCLLVDVNHHLRVTWYIHL